METLKLNEIEQMSVLPHMTVLPAFPYHENAKCHTISSEMAGILLKKKVFTCN